MGRQPGQWVKADRFESKILLLVEQGHSYRAIASQLHLSKTTVSDIVKRHKQKTTPSVASVSIGDSES